MSRRLHSALAVAILSVLLLVSCGSDGESTVGPVGPVGPQDPVGPAEVGDDGDGVEGSGEVVSESRTVAEFTNVVLAGEGAVVITEGPSGPLTVETDDNLLELIETTVDGDTLVIRTRDGIDIDPTDSVRYAVDVPHLGAIELQGAGSFHVATWSADDALVVLRGAGDIRIDDFAGTSLTAELSGAGVITIAGMTRTQVLTAPGAGEYVASDLESGTATVDIDGTVSATLWATDALDVAVSGVGEVAYYGEPVVAQEVTAPASLVALGPR